MLKIAGIIVVVLIVAAVAVVAYASTRPDSFSVQRTASIKAPPEKIFPLINDYRNWPQWSPYENRDPEMKRTYSGGGQGAKYAGGNKNVQRRNGDRRHRAAAQGSDQARFQKPFEAHIAELRSSRRAKRQRHVGDAGRCAAGQVMHMVMDIDKMVIRTPPPACQYESRRREVSEG